MPKEKPDHTDIQAAIACILNGQELDDYMKPLVIDAIKRCYMTVELRTIMCPKCGLRFPKGERCPQCPQQSQNGSL